MVPVDFVATLCATVTGCTALQGRGEINDFRPIGTHDWDVGNCVRAHPHKSKDGLQICCPSQLCHACTAAELDCDSGRHLDDGIFQFLNSKLEKGLRSVATVSSSCPSAHRSLCCLSLQQHVFPSAL